MIVTYSLEQSKQMTNATLSEQYVLSILHQESEGADFPINFDDIWESSGYTEKRSAVRFLKTCDGLIEGKDYRFSTQLCQTPQGGRSRNFIYMTSDGYQFFLSKSNTEQGYTNLRHLIDIRKEYVKQLELQLKASLNETNKEDDLRAELNSVVKQLGDAQKWAIEGEATKEILEEELEQANGYNNNLLEDLEKLTEENQKLIAKNKELEREKKRAAYDEHQKIDIEIRQMLHLYKDVIAENEKLKGENYKVHKDLNDRRKGFLKKVEKENFKLRDLVEQLKQIQKECFLATKYARGLLSDFEDLRDSSFVCNYDKLVDKLVAKIKPKIYQAYALNETENKLLEVDIDWGKIIDERTDSDKTLFSNDDDEQP